MSDLTPLIAVLGIFISALFKTSDWIELRCIKTWEEKGKKKSKVTKRPWLRKDEFDIEAISEQLSKLNSGDNPSNIFFGVCPRLTKGKGASKDIRIVRALWADVDYCKPEEAIKRVKNANLPAPSIVINSGHGVHLYWLLTRPIPIQTKKGQQQMQSVLCAVQQAVGGDHTQDLARLLRLPGFLNVKNARNGAEKMSCGIVSIHSDRRYSLSQFAQIVETMQIDEEPETSLAESADGPIGRLLARLRETPVGERSEVDFGACCELIRLGRGKDEAWRLVHDRSKFAEKNGKKYFERTWKKALKECKKESSHEKAESLIPSNIQVLGMDEKNRTILWVEDNRRIWKIQKLREIDKCMLIQIAGRDCLKVGIEYTEVRNAIAQASRKHCFGPDDHIGKGIWRMPGKPGLLVLSGDQAMMLENGVKGMNIRTVEVPVIGKRLLEFNAADKWIDLNWLEQYVQEVTPEKTKSLWDQLTKCLDCWLPDLDTDYDVIAGMILATAIQGTLPFRPHVWIPFYGSQ